MKLVIELLSQENLSASIHFLMHHEKTCLSLCAHFFAKNTICLPQNLHDFFLIVNQKTKNIEALIMITKAGFVLHCFSFAEKQSLDEIPIDLYMQLQTILKPILQKKMIYSIAGSKIGTHYLCLLNQVEPLQTNDYFLFECPKNTKNKRLLCPQFSFRSCTVDDIEIVYPLQKIYEQVEVLPKNKTHSEKLCKLSLKKSLLSQQIYVVFFGSIPVAKAGTNASFIHCGQIGGVFTHPDFRSKGIACFLVSLLQNYLAEQEKSSVLFVRKKNIPAIKAYTKAGFYEIGEYAIVYFN